MIPVRNGPSYSKITLLIVQLAQLPLFVQFLTAKTAALLTGGPCTTDHLEAKSTKMLLKYDMKSNKISSYLHAVHECGCPNLLWNTEQGVLNNWSLHQYGSFHSSSEDLMTISRPVFSSLKTARPVFKESQDLGQASWHTSLENPISASTDESMYAQYGV